MSYYRNYRRPYYHYRRRYNKRQHENFVSLIVFSIIILFFLPAFLTPKFNLGVFLGKAFVWGIVILIIITVVTKVLKNSKKVSINQVQIVQKSDTQINSIKHGCKCYMDGLSEGEQKIADILSEGLSYKDYFIFNNIILPSDRNISSQIDHLVVSKFGIFVIESKDFKGWIFGDKNEDSWTQSLPGGNNKFQFQNPIRQNWSHIMALRNLLQFIPDESFKSIVVFSNSSEIKTTSIDNVLKSDELVRYIENFKDVKLSEESIQLVIGKLSYLCQTVDITAEQHIANITSAHSIL